MYKSGPLPLSLRWFKNKYVRNHVILNKLNQKGGSTTTTCAMKQIGIEHCHIKPRGQPA